MNSTCTARFWQLLEALPADAQNLAKKNHKLWLVNPRHPSLRFKHLKGNVWSVRVGQHYRALAEVEGNEVTCLWIGTHAEYDHLIR